MWCAIALALPPPPPLCQAGICYRMLWGRANLLLLNDGGAVHLLGTTATY